MSEQDKGSDDGRFQIVLAAASCFMRKGYENTTIDEIADELGATKGRVYHYFRSKNAIFFAVYRQAMRYCFDAVNPIAELALPADERLFRMAEVHALVMMRTIAFQRGIKQGVEIYLRTSTTEKDRKALYELIDMRDDYEKIFRRILSEGVSDGTLSPPDIAISGRAILAALNGLTDWYRDKEESAGAKQAEIARTMAMTIVYGVKRLSIRT